MIKKIIENLLSFVTLKKQIIINKISFLKEYKKLDDNRHENYNERLEIIFLKAMKILCSINNFEMHKNTCKLPQIKSYNYNTLNAAKIYV